jgi:hypothetical protein
MSDSISEYASFSDHSDHLIENNNDDSRATTSSSSTTSRLKSKSHSSSSTTHPFSLSNANNEDKRANNKHRVVSFSDDEEDDERRRQKSNGAISKSTPNTRHTDSNQSTNYKPIKLVNTSDVHRNIAVSSVFKCFVVLQTFKTFFVVDFAARADQTQKLRDGSDWGFQRRNFMVRKDQTPSLSREVVRDSDFYVARGRSRRRRSTTRATRIDAQPSPRTRRRHTPPDARLYFDREASRAASRRYHRRPDPTAIDNNNNNNKNNMNSNNNESRVELGNIGVVNDGEKLTSVPDSLTIRKPDGTRRRSNWFWQFLHHIDGVMFDTTLWLEAKSSTQPIVIC